MAHNLAASKVCRSGLPIGKTYDVINEMIMDVIDV